MNGRAMNSDGAEITLTNASVAQVESRGVYLSFPSSGDTVRGALVILDLSAIGTATLRARLGELADSITVRCRSE